VLSWNEPMSPGGLSRDRHLRSSEGNKLKVADADCGFINDSAMILEGHTVPGVRVHDCKDFEG
jgi:hypothetical protein